MADLIQMDTDEEIDKYDEATLIASNPPPLATTKNKMAVYNPLNGRNDVLVPLSLGGYVKLGEEPVDRLAEVRDYADTLDRPFDMADYEAAGFTQKEVEDAGIMPQRQEKPARTEPLREGEELRMRREGAAMVTPDDPTMRQDLTRLTFENTEGDLRQIFEVLGIDRSTARKMAEGLWGNPESTRDLGLGVADFTPAGLFFGAQEGMRTFQRGRNTGDPLTIGMGALEAGLSFLEALPLTAAGAKGLKASMPTIRNALTELGRRMNQPGDMPTTSSFGAGAIDDLVIRDIEKIYAVDRPDIVKDMFVDDETAALVLGELRADDPLADAASLNELQNVRSELYNQTQSRLANLPDEITVYRAGDLNENDGISSFTLNPNYNPNLQLPWNELRGSPRLKAYTVKKSDILATPDLIRDFGEGEVIIRNSSVQLAPIDDAISAAGPETSTGLPGRISTRLPTAKAATEDPLTGTLVVGLEEMKADPKLYEFNVNITKDYPNMRVAPNATVDETSEQFITHVKDNLLYLHDKVPADTRARSQKWYDGARAVTDRWQAEYDVPDTSIAGALAALSPQKDWYQNVSLAKRTLDVVVNQKDFAFSPEMLTTFENIPALNKPAYQEMRKFLDGKTYAEISHPDPKVENGLKAMFVRLYDQTYNKPDYPIVSPEGDFLDLARTQAGNPKKAAWGSLNEIGKAVAAIEANGDVNIISPLMGERHKVRNFYNNIYDPNSPLGDVTIDTHAVAAGLLRPLSGNALEVDHNFKNMSVKGRGTTKGSAKTGVSGNYGLYAEAYRRAAAERGIQPRQMQSITWEAVRGLFTDTFKSNQKNVAEVDSIWQRYKDGEIELDETRRLVDERAGGINPPTWE